MKHHILLFTFLVFFKGSFSVDPFYEDCAPKHCGDGRTIKFPFFIQGIQESHCGYPGFEIHCNHGFPIRNISFPVINISGNNYSFENIDYEAGSMRLLNSPTITCLPAIKNVTLDGNLFRINGSSTSELVFLTNCSKELPTILTRYMTESCGGPPAVELVMDSDDANLGMAKEVCSHVVVAPVEEHGGEGRSKVVVDGRNYAEVANRGFTLFWSAQECVKCERSGGRCGYKWFKFQFLCFCPHSIETESCPNGIGSLDQRFKKNREDLPNVNTLVTTSFWGSKENEKRITWVAWKLTLNRMDHGGLGIGSLKSLNYALLMSWWWKFGNGTNSLWKEVIKSMYGVNGKLEELLPVTKRAITWGKICGIRDELAMFDIDTSALFYEANGRWNWSLESDGVFSVKSIRTALEDQSLVNDDISTWWCKTVPNKVNILVWRARRDRMSTKINLIRRNVPSITPLCPLCSIHEETEEHIFLRCSTAKEVIAKLSINWKEMPNPDEVNSLNDLFKGVHGRVDERSSFGVQLCAVMWTL